MFPIRDHNPSQSTPWVTGTLIAINIVVYLAGVATGTDNQSLYLLYQNWALIPADLTGGGPVHPLISSLFLHAGFMHLAGNMLFLWVFGDNMEDAFGHLGFLVFYLACGVGAGLVYVSFQPGSAVPLVGASGAIAGVLGGYMLLYPRARVDIFFFFFIFFKIIPIPAWVTLAVWFGLQVMGLSGGATGGGGIAYWAHVGGFLLGVAFTLPLWLRRGHTKAWVETGGRPPQPEANTSFKKSDIPTVQRRR